MPRGDKSKYTDKQKRKAEHIEDGYEARGVSEKDAERRAWATVNKESGGGNKSGSGRGVRDTKVAARKGGQLGGRTSAKRPAAKRSASAKKAAAARSKPAARTKAKSAAGSKSAAHSKAAARARAAAHSNRGGDARLQEKAPRRSDRLDQALKMTFPASDPIAVGVPTSTEPLQPLRDGTAPERKADVSGPIGSTAQHWVQICVLPWAMWTALGLMMTGWPLMQARDAARRISDRNDTHLKS